jgi:hypothetical protein
MSSAERQVAGSDLIKQVRRPLTERTERNVEEEFMLKV